MSGDARTVMHMALAAFVAARGGSAADADRLLSALYDSGLPESPGEAYEQMQAAWERL